MKDWTQIPVEYIRLFLYHYGRGIKISKTYWPKERNTSKLTKYQLNKLRKNV